MQSGSPSRVAGVPATGNVQRPGSAVGSNKLPQKKLTISLKKEKPKLPDSFEEDTWMKLKLCINAVHTETPVGQSFEELYKAVEDLCIHKLGQGLYSRLEDECQKHIEKSIRNLTGQTPDPVLFLELVHMCWNKHSSQMSLIRSIFLYLDRTYVIQAANVSSIWDLGLSLFRRHLEACSEVHGKIREGILKLILLERKGDMVDRGRLRGLVRMLVELGLYAPLEQAVVGETHDFYRMEADACMQAMDVPAYLAHVQRRLDEENERVAHYLDAATRKAPPTPAPLPPPRGRAEPSRKGGGCRR